MYAVFHCHYNFVRNLDINITNTTTATTTLSNSKT